MVSTPGAGHVTPLVQIIGALLAGGDDVMVASGLEAAPIIEKAGARFALAGRSQGHWMERLAARTRGGGGRYVSGDGHGDEWVVGPIGGVSLTVTPVPDFSLSASHHTGTGRSSNASRRAAALMLEPPAEILHIADGQQ